LIDSGARQRDRDARGEPKTNLLFFVELKLFSIDKEDRETDGEKCRQHP
jgi:hypothetical protein